MATGSGSNYGSHASSIRSKNSGNWSSGSPPRRELSAAASLLSLGCASSGANDAKNLRAALTKSTGPGGGGSSKKRENNMEPLPANPQLTHLVDRLMQLQDCIKQVTGIIQGLEKSDDPSANEQMLKLGNILQEMQREEQEHLEVLHGLLGENHKHQQQYHQQPHPHPVQQQQRPVREAIQSLASVPSGPPIGLMNGDFIGLIEEEFEAPSPARLAELMVKLKESQDKLNSLQDEQSRLLSLQQRAENKLAEMSHSKKLLEESQAEARNSVVSNDRMGAQTSQSIQNSSPAHCLRDLSSRLRALQDKLVDGPRNVEIPEEDQSPDFGEEPSAEQEEMDGFMLQLELQKRKALENKLKDLQKKKDKMDDLLKDIQYQQQQQQQHHQQHQFAPQPPQDQRQRHVHSRSPVSNSQRPQRRYEADGSEEDEVRMRQVIQRSNVNSLADGKDTRGFNGSNLTNKYKELEEAEQKLKQIEEVIRLIEEHEREITDEVDGTSVPLQPSSRKASNEETGFLSKYPELAGYFQSKQPAERNGWTEPKRVGRQAEELPVTRSSAHEGYLNEANGHPTTPQSMCSDVQNQNLVATFAGLNFNVPSPFENGMAFESPQTMKERCIQSLQNHFDSMVAVIENQFVSQTPFLNNNNMMYLMLMQNYQAMQQQQMLFYWFQQQSQQHQCSQQNVCQNCESVRVQDNFASTPLPPGASHCPSRTSQRQGQTLNVRTQSEAASAAVTLNNQVAPGLRANNYYDNFKSYSRQNQLSAATNGFSPTVSKSNENFMLANHGLGYSSNFAPIIGATANAALSQPPTQELHPMPTANGVPPTSSYPSVRRPKKAANASQQHNHQHDHAAEKVQNAPANEPLPKAQSSQSVDLNALYSVLDKFVNEEKRESKSTGKIKSSNLILLDNDEGAVGGVEGGVSSTTTEAVSEHGSLLAVGAAHPVPMGLLPISPSTGAIRKKPRNLELVDSTSKQENCEDISALTETIRPPRPLMAADGRPSETRTIGAVGPLTPQPPPSVSQPPSHLLLKRPPTTGKDDAEDNSSSSTDDDLAEADQTALEMSATEAEPHVYVSSSQHVGGSGNNNSSVQMVDSSSIPEDQDPIENEDEEEDNMSAGGSNESGVRLSGDGEQGL